MMRDKIQDIMQDWDNTPIVATDVLVFVNIKQLSGIGKSTYIDPENKMEYKTRVNFGPYFIGWKTMWETTVTEIDGVLYCELPRHPAEPITMVPVDLIWDLHKQGEGGKHGNFYCIKGISDNEQEFFKQHFRRNMSGLN